MCADIAAAPALEATQSASMSQIVLMLRTLCFVPRILRPSLVVKGSASKVINRCREHAASLLKHSKQAEYMCQLAPTWFVAPGTAVPGQDQAVALTSEYVAAGLLGHDLSLGHFRNTAGL